MSKDAGQCFATLCVAFNTVSYTWEGGGEEHFQMRSSSICLISSSHSDMCASSGG